MSEDRIGRPGPARKERQGLPEAFRRGNRMRAGPGLSENDGKPGKMTEKQWTHRTCAWEMIV
jgi:hypothetical protein